MTGVPSRVRNPLRVTDPPAKSGILETLALGAAMRTPERAVQVNDPGRWPHIAATARLVSRMSSGPKIHTRFVDRAGVAEWFGKSESWFDSKRQELEAAGFPRRDDIVGAWDVQAMDAWADRRSAIVNDKPAAAGGGPAPRLGQPRRRAGSKQPTIA